MGAGPDAGHCRKPLEAPGISPRPPARRLARPRTDAKVNFREAPLALWALWELWELWELWAL